MTGAGGFLLGGTAGILTTQVPFLFASFSGLQCFVLGTTFWGTRSSILQVWTPQQQHEQLAPRDLIKATTLSGGITGGVVGALTRGRRNVLPGILMCSLAGFAGQWIHNALQASRIKRQSEDPEMKKGFWERMSGRGWSLMKVMSDEEYMQLLKNKQLVVDAEIGVLEDKIVALRKQQEQEVELSRSTSPESQGP